MSVSIPAPWIRHGYAHHLQIRSFFFASRLLAPPQKCHGDVHNWDHIMFKVGHEPQVVIILALKPPFFGGVFSGMLKTSTCHLLTGAHSPFDMSQLFSSECVGSRNECLYRLWAVSHCLPVGQSSFPDEQITACGWWNPIGSMYGI